MIGTPEITIGRISVARSDVSVPLKDLVDEAVSPLRRFAGEIGAVVAATFSNPERFPSLAVRVADMMGLPKSTMAFDLNMACSAYPYAVYLAGKITSDIGRQVLVVDGDAQLRLVDGSDRATGNIFSDAVSATMVGMSGSGNSRWMFLSSLSDSLRCSESGPISMDGMAVFSFVAKDVAAMLREFAGDAGSFDWFAPHQANPYMVRQLARALGLEDKLITLPEEIKNPGSASIPLAISASGKTGRFMIAGFGAGYSAAAGTVRVTGE